MNKRLIALALALLMLLSLTACKKTAEETEPAETTTATEPTETIYGVAVDPESSAEIDENAEAVVRETTEADQETETVESDATQAESPAETTAPTTKPTEPAPSMPVTGTTEYEAYQAMSGAEQKAFMESFGSVEAFFDWLNAAKAEYEEKHPVIEIDGDPITAEEVLELIE